VTMAIARSAGAWETAPLSFRKNVAMLRGPQLAAFRQAMTASMGVSDDRGWQHWAGLHGLPLPMYCQHHTPLFLPWHRAYLYLFELTLKEHEPTASMPWWDWTSPQSHDVGLPPAYTEESDADGVDNPLVGSGINRVAREQGGEDSPRRTFREPDDPANLPTEADVEALLELGDFSDFQDQLEQVHDAVHVWVGGTVGEIPFAAYDPIFWAHHVMVDRIWRLWQLRHPTAGVPASLIDQALPPFNLTVRETLSVTALGYDYASFSSRTIVDGLPPEGAEVQPLSLRLELPRGEDVPKISRADLTFYGLDHSTRSYRARIFFDQPDATPGTPTSSPGYAGSFSVLGHGGCFGDEGHCTVRGAVTAFDRRPPHQLVPASRVVICTEPVRRLIADGHEVVTVTVVPTERTAASARRMALSFDQVSLHMYE